ncbi:phosphoribosylamine--glycine ligase [Caloranaerobacter azorensis DSM 13643]|uniref:Phosphoribosylamine--glycine ligase n=1 Tax=Caloranaerobacter azorensis DSM 13643 TaxID=1121264 RepID=A0A1M5V8H7_9FIRM|nr:phosphoribosylamine--glycine ligase [Caloranaerobacter azorensis]SHH71521.1 phosphoribosylamine--glycine ligase [Caloranaerobacter azorensis DSM 13643]
MKVLVVGGGAREHAIVWKVSKSPKVSKIYCIPSNGGISEIAENVNIKAEDIELLLGFALKENIDLTIVGPEAPLVEGIVDKFKEKGLDIIGPDKKGAMLEGSKIFAKKFMERYNIPTAKYKTFKDSKNAIEALGSFEYPLVVKADGLAGGKGVVICKTRQEAEKTVIDMMEKKKFGLSGENIVIEEYLEGIEASLLCIIDGKKIIPMESAKDYKKIFEGDEGPNTGGMGCFSPHPLFTQALKNTIREEILDRIMYGLKMEKIFYQGILFIGLMLTKDGPKVLEFNVRMGDPETEVILPRLKSDIIEVFEKTLSGELIEDDLKWEDKYCVCVVAASRGYPISYEKGKLITGLDRVDKEVIVFHGGTKKVDDKIYTNGGRVLTVTALGNSLEEAREIAYDNIEKINFENMYYRKDIGKLGQ